MSTMEDEVQMEAGRIGGEGILRRLAKGTALSHSSAMYVYREYRDAEGVARAQVLHRLLLKLHVSSEF